MTDLHGVDWGQTRHLAAPGASGAPRRSPRLLPIPPLGAARNGFWRETVEFWSTTRVFGEKRPRNGRETACTGAPPGTGAPKGSRRPSLARLSQRRARPVAVWRCTAALRFGCFSPSPYPRPLPLQNRPERPPGPPKLLNPRSGPCNRPSYGSIKPPQAKNFNSPRHENAPNSCKIAYFCHYHGSD